MKPHCGQQDEDKPSETLSSAASLNRLRQQ
jgi:hypothetical protein